MSPRCVLAGRLREVVALDVRSLALFRMAVGAILLVDLAFRSTDFTAMYAPDGLAPVELVRSLQPASFWSLHFIHGAAGFQAAMFVVAATLAVMLLLGWQTRLATVGSWALLVSLHNRLPVVLTGADLMLRMLLFWAMFLPLGAVWSLDARRRRGAPPATPIASPASVGFIVQLALVYWLSGWAKWKDLWLHENALQNVLTSRLFAMPLGMMLAEHPTLTHWLSRSVVVFELAAPCLLFIPYQAARLRLLVITAMAAFHLGIVLTVAVALFSWVALAGWLALLPRAFWDRWRRAEQIASRSEVASSESAHWGNPASRIRPCFTALCCWTALALGLYANWCNVAASRLPKPVHRALRQAAALTSLHQSWAMFSDASARDCWFGYEAWLADGRQLDLLAASDRHAPREHAFIWQQTQNDRWRKLHWNMLSDYGRPYAQPLAEYIRRLWNRTHGSNEQVVRVAVYSHTELSPGSPEEESFVTTNLATATVDGANFAAAIRGELDPY